jgi:radical SAM superfamily enzyme YgiQ (UPF0313 family)
MRALLVQAESPPTYWGYQHSLPFIGKRAALPPLGLATLAAHLPATWSPRIRDLHLAPLADADLAWADAVLVSGMLAQAASIRAVLARARSLGKRTVLGGPAATTSPDAFPEASHVFQGEAEGRLELLVAALEGRRAAPRVLSPADVGRPDLATARVPRFDLLELDAYATLSLQVSRGCPFSCEFCDIVEVFGRVPRVKAPAQVIAELEALWRLGARGPLFLVDDNFIGNRRAAARILAAVAAWQRTHGAPFDLVTEASIDLAAHPALLAAMVEAGFSAVFVGIESPSAEALASAGKRQNLRLDAVEAVRTLTRAGLEVYCGLIVGFDTDDERIFDRQAELVAALPVARAMIGILSALPGTALWRRLEREGRLRGPPTGDQFGRPNFDPAMGEARLLEGYRRLLATVYDEDAYFRRCALLLDFVPAGAGALRAGALRTLARTVWRLGLRGERRRWFWRLLARGLRRGGLAAVPRAVTLAVVGEHLVRYTAEEVLPRIARLLDEATGATATPGVPPRATPVEAGGWRLPAAPATREGVRA